MMLTKQKAHSPRYRRCTPALDDGDDGLDGQNGVGDGHLWILTRRRVALRASRHGIVGRDVSETSDLVCRESAYCGLTKQDQPGAVGARVN